MNLIPLIDRTGAVRAWLDRKSGWICNATGNVFAVIEFDGFFRSNGTQVGWWFGDDVRERHGRVVLARPNAKIDGLSILRPQKNLEAPFRPTAAEMATAAAHEAKRVGRF